MATRNRLSMAGAGGTALLENLDAFKRKHVVQNQEIIRKNSELMKTNGDLTTQLRESQQDLMMARGEAIRLKGANFQLDMQNAHLREMLRREQERNRELESAIGNGTIGSPFGQKRAQLLRQALQGIAENAKQAQCLIEEAHLRPMTTERAPIEDELVRAVRDMVIPLAAESSSPSQATAAAMANLPKSRRATLATQPDLSLISEGSSEAEVREASSSRANTPVEAQRSSSPVLDAMRRLDRRASGKLPTPQLAHSTSDHLRRSVSTTPPDSPPPAAIKMTVADPVRQVARPGPARATVPTAAQRAVEHSQVKRRLDLGAEQSPQWPSASALAAATAARKTSVLAARADDRAQPLRTPQVSAPTSSAANDRHHGGAPVERSSSVTSGVPVAHAAAAQTSYLPSARNMKPRASGTDESAKAASMRQIVKPRHTSGGAVPRTSSVSLQRGPPPPAVLADPSESSTSDEARGPTAAGVAHIRALREVTNRRNNIPEVKVIEKQVTKTVQGPLIVQGDGGTTDEDEDVMPATVSRRAKKEINYAMPSLNSKMRRPEDYVPTIPRNRKSRLSHRKSYAPATRKRDTGEEDQESDESESYATANDR